MNVNEAVKAANIEMLDNYNLFPPVYELITHEQWMYDMLADSYSHTAKLFHKQVTEPPFLNRPDHATWRKTLWSVRLYYGHLLQIGLAKTHTYHADKDAITFPWATHPMVKFFSDYHYKETAGYFVYFFKWGCQHKNTEKWSPRMFEHRVKCKDCGYEWGYDSSG